MNTNSAYSYKGKSRLQSIALKIIKISHSRSIYGREWRKTWWHDGDFKLFSINALKHSNDTKRQQYFAWFNCAWFFFRGKLLVHSPLWIFSLYVLVSWWRWNCCTMWKRIHMRGEKKSQFFACNVECFRFYFFFILLFDPSHALVTGFWRTTAVKKIILLWWTWTVANLVRFTSACSFVLKKI